MQTIGNKQELRGNIQDKCIREVVVLNAIQAAAASLFILIPGIPVLLYFAIQHGKIKPEELVCL